MKRRIIAVATILGALAVAVPAVGGDDWMRAGGGQSMEDVEFRISKMEDVGALKDLPFEPAGLKKRLHRSRVLKDLPKGHEVSIVYKYDTGHDYVLHSITPYDEDDELDGVQHFYLPSGKHSKTITWEEGVKDGPERHYTNRGVLEAEIPYVEGVVHGTKKTFYNARSVRSETEFVEGKAHGVSRTYTLDGYLVNESHFVEGKRHGELIDYYPPPELNGGEEEEGEEDAEEGEEEEKVVRRRLPYVEGEIHGVAKQYYKDGTLKSETQFVEDRMHGREKRYDGEGNLENTYWYYEGERVTGEDFRKRSAADKKGE